MGNIAKQINTSHKLYFIANELEANSGIAHTAPTVTPISILAMNPFTD